MGRWEKMSEYEAKYKRIRELEISGWMRIARWKAWANALEKRMVKPVKKISKGWYEWSVKGYREQSIELKLDSEFEMITQKSGYEDEEKENDWDKVYYFTSGDFDVEGQKTGLWIESLKHPQFIPEKQNDPGDICEWNKRCVYSFINNIQKRVSDSFVAAYDEFINSGEIVDTDVRKNCWASMANHMEALNEKIKEDPYEGVTLFYVDGKLKHVIQGFISPMKRSWIQDDHNDFHIFEKNQIVTKGPFTRFYKNWMCEECAPGDWGLCTCENKDEELGGEGEEEYDYEDEE